MTEHHPTQPQPLGRPQPGELSGFDRAGHGHDAVADLGYATLDLGREARQGLPEVVYGPGKTDDEIIAIVDRLLATSVGPVLVTRVEPAVAAAVLAAARPGGIYHAQARLLVWRPAPIAPTALAVCVVTAGTADGPVAAEAAETCAAIGLRVDRINDVGVAGIQRVLRVADRIAAADIVICVAGMEGALASVVGGMVRVPVVAVPTSTGYGASLDGVTALLAMLSSCAAGLTVVNIDSGFGAAIAAFRVATAAGRVPASQEPATAALESR